MGKQVRPAPLDPIQRAFAQPPQQRHVLGEEEQAQRDHPQSKDREDRETTSDDQQQTCRDPRPARRRVSQPVYRHPPALRQAMEQTVESIAVVRRGAFARRPGAKA
jgi:hypothetical protein